MSGYETLRHSPDWSELVGPDLRVTVSEQTAEIQVRDGEAALVTTSSSERCGILLSTTDALTNPDLTVPPFVYKDLSWDNEQALVECETGEGGSDTWCFTHVGLDKRGVHVEVHVQALPGKLAPAVGYRLLIEPSPVLLPNGWPGVARPGSASSGAGWSMKCTGTPPVIWRFGSCLLDVVAGFSVVELRPGPGASTIAVTVAIPPGRGRSVRGTLRLAF